MSMTKRSVQRMAPLWHRHFSIYQATHKIRKAALEPQDPTIAGYFDEAGDVLAKGNVRAGKAALDALARKVRRVTAMWEFCIASRTHLRTYMAERGFARQIMPVWDK